MTETMNVGKTAPRKASFFNSLVFKLLVGIGLGILVGNYAPEGLMKAIVTFKGLFSNLISYVVPLIILGFITPAIVSLKDSAGKILTVTLIICYLSSVGAALLSVTSGYAIIPHLNIAAQVGTGKALPDPVVELSFPPIMPVLTALITAILIGLAVVWSKSQRWSDLLTEFNDIVLSIVNKVVVPVLPIYIFTTFAGLSYEGVIIKELPVFLKIILIVILGHYIWMTLLYALGGLFSKRNPMGVVKHYLPAYLTALGTMSSAATLPVALQCARKSDILDPEIRDFVIPVCSNTHLCGSVLTETFFVMVVSQILYGKIPEFSTMMTFALLLGIFAIAAPGVPGGTVVASLGLIISVLGFDDNGTALMLSIFALQDSFGTACNITGDGAIALMVTGLFNKVPQTKAQN